MTGSVSNFYTVKTPRTWNEAKTLMDQQWRSLKDTATVGFLFRGQADADWKLTTSLERTQGRNRTVQPELDLLERFRAAAHLYADPANLPRGYPGWFYRDRLEWLALMQHHGAPTRLLDWTRSPYVAAYFALWNGREGHDAAVWAVNGWWLEVSTSSRLGSALATTIPRRITLEWLESDQAEQELEWFFDTNAGGTSRGVVTLEPTRMNQRLRLQQGLFLAPLAAYVPFEDNLRTVGDRPEENVYKVVLPSDLRREALEELDLMNINHETLFPGLDGYAQAAGVRLSITAPVS